MHRQKDGISWIDVCTLMTGIKGINDMEVELTVTTGTQGHNGLLNFTVSAWVPTVEAHQTRTIAEVKGSWPDKFHPTFDSCIFKALYDLDYAISKATRKEGIPKA